MRGMAAASEFAACGGTPAAAGLRCGARRPRSAVVDHDGPRSRPSLSGVAAAIVAAIFAGTTLWRRRASGSRAHKGLTRSRGVATACLVVLLTALAIFWIAPRSTRGSQSSDASVYLAAANRVSHAGAIGGDDALASEMSTQERSAMFANRFPGDSTGPFARFPGGVRLIGPDSGWVTFHFYHLWPVWLGSLHSLFGNPGFLAALPLFGSLALIRSFSWEHFSRGVYSDSHVSAYSSSRTPRSITCVCP